MVSIAPNSDPFRGGSYTPAAVPTLGPTGSIAGASVGGSLIAGVSAGQPMLARVDRGSNVTVPYARLVMPAPGRTALPAFKKTDEKVEYTTLGKPVGDTMVETENLYSGRVCFVLGRRGVAYDSRQIGALLGEETRRAGATSVTSRQAAQMDRIAPPGAGDLHSFTRLCSYEYLERYFDHVFRSASITLPSLLLNPDAPNFGQISKFSPFTRSLDADTTVLNVNGTALLVQNRVDPQRGSPDARKLATAQYSGIFAGDVGPFLRGKTLETTLLETKAAGRGALTSGKRKFSLALGDEVAFQRLETELRAKGMLDWVPDGIIMSKYSGGSPGGDVMRDDDIDAREGQLYNVAISGPAITSSWTGDKDLEVMPLDKVFVCIVADVFEDDETAKALTDAFADKNRTAEGVEKAAVAAMGEGGSTYNGTADEFFQTGGFKFVTNFNVMRMTSSQFHRYSAYRPGSDKSRLGLPIGPRGGRYIIGGWCIGQVTDSSAARATHDGVVVGTSGKAKSMHAANVLVKPEWWSADLMYRKYMNRPVASGSGGAVRSRFELRYRKPAESAMKATAR